MPLPASRSSLIDVSKPPGNDLGAPVRFRPPVIICALPRCWPAGGTLDGQRIMSRATLKLMTADHLGSRLPLAATPGGMVLGASTYTFGLGFAVRPGDGIAPSRDPPETSIEGGYAGTFFWVDPKGAAGWQPSVDPVGRRLAPHRQLLYRQLVYQAIAD